MKKIYKSIICSILLLALLINLTGCYGPIGIEEFGYVLAIGIDYINDNTIELTLQFATAGSEDSSGSSMQSTKINMSSIKCTSVDSGITLINSHISKKINLAHCNVIVFSEELAKNGLESYLDSLINNTELTNDAEMIISKCSAKEFIEHVNPVFEGLLSKYYTGALQSDSYTAYSVNMNLATFYCLLKDTYFEPYAIIGNISEKNDQKNNNKDSSQQPENSSIESSVNANFIAGDYNISDKNPIQLVGFAAFKDDKFVGEFTGLDSICFLMINNEFKETILSIPSPFEENKYINISTTQKSKTKSKVTFNNESPVVHVNVYLKGFGQSINNKTSYSNKDSLCKIKESAETYVKENIEKFLYKTCKEYNSDICGFGRFCVKHFATMEDWEMANWLNNYKNCEFDVNVSFEITGGSVFSEI